LSVEHTQHTYETVQLLLYEVFYFR